MRMRTTLRRAALGAAIVLALSGAAVAADAPPDALTDARFFTSASGSQGVFPGKLVCLCCDFQSGAPGKTACKEEHHRYGLKIEGDPTVHPLVPGDANAMKQLSGAELHDKEVSVTGKLYPAVGIIVVAGITPKQ